MSIILDALKKRITWGEAAKQVEAWGEKIVTGTPGAAAAVDATVSAVKQGLSNAVAYSDTALAAHMTDLTSASETAADAAIMALTGGKFPLTMLPLINGTIDQIEAAGAAAYHTWALAMKAKLAGQAPGSQGALALASSPVPPAGGDPGPIG